MFEARERATAQRPQVSRSVKLPGKAAITTDRAAIDIARELRANSKLGKSEKRLADAEKKLHG